MNTERAQRFKPLCILRALCDSVLSFDLTYMKQMIAMRKLIALGLLLLLISSATVDAKTKVPRHEVLGISLGMNEEVVRERLRKIADQQKEEREKEGEGEQEVWTLRHDKRFDYLIVRFDKEHRLWFMTAVVRKDHRMPYSDLADIKSARQQTDGRNYTFTWIVPSRGKVPRYAVVARGGDPQYLVSYSIYRLFEK